jgi:Ca2+/Na+ antiporter
MVVGFLVLAIMTGWAPLAIYYSHLSSEIVRAGISIAFATCTVVLFLLFRKRFWTVIIGFLVAFCLIVVWWLNIKPSNDRNWQPDVAVLPYATIQDHLVTIHNIRNLHYRTETDFDENYYDKTFDLNVLNSVDLIAVYWMGDAIAHIMMSFGFQGKDFVAFSIETRKEKGEGYSTIKGFFKQYELIYIAGDERDLIRVRTDYRNPQEEVYLYRIRFNRERGRKLFMEYIKQINAMKKRPVWYNTLTTNCTTNIVMHIKTFTDRIRYSWKILLSGYTPLYAYERGALDTSIPFTKLRKQSHINPKAHVIGNDPEFSRKIREGLPVPGQ